MHRNFWLWIGGLLGLLIMGSLRFLGKLTNIFGLLIGMAVVIAILSVAIITYVHRRW